MACSLAHEGEANLSLARIQVLQDILRNWPDDIQVVQCRQCANPLCVEACPTGALYVDVNRGNVRVIDDSRCDGCELCIEACPYLPQRIIWNHRTHKAIKCDLCIDTPYWEETGGPDGRQACVEVCPRGAIKFTKEVPNQRDDAGYDLNLGEVA
jgi:protein NrfC